MSRPCSSAVLATLQKKCRAPLDSRKPYALLVPMDGAAIRDGKGATSWNGSKVKRRPHRVSDAHETNSPLHAMVAAQIRRPFTTRSNSMNTLRTVMLATGIVLLTGCAAAPKPVMSDKQHYSFALQYTTVNKCGESGQMAPDTASRGLTLLRGSLSNYIFDPAAMETAVGAFATDIPTNSQCNAAAMDILALTRRIDQQNAANASNQRAWADAINSFNNSLTKQAYTTNPYTPTQIPQTVQPSFGNTGGEQYQTIMVNTPNGIVHKRCKVLNGQVVACF